MTLGVFRRFQFMENSITPHTKIVQRCRGMHVGRVDWENNNQLVRILGDNMFDGILHVIPFVKIGPGFLIC